MSRSPLGLHDSEWVYYFFLEPAEVILPSNACIVGPVTRVCARERERATTPPRWPSGMRGSPTKHLLDRQRNIERIDFGTLVDVNRPQRALAFF